MKVDFSSHLEHYKENGFTIFPGLFDEGQMNKWRERHQQLYEEFDNRTWFGNMLEYAPRLLWPAVSNPTILDFAELVMGPFVQLDNLTLAFFHSVPKTEVEGKVSGWHRDRWAQVPRSSTYERPNAINAISYLQDLTDEMGPLRVIVGSHRRPLTIDPDDRGKPHPQETVINMQAGDVVMTHVNLVHSGTPNTSSSGENRYFFSIFYNLTWLKHTDNHSGPLTQQLLAAARAHNDHRLMRLLGADEQLQARCNSGFLTPDEQRWAEWAAADRKTIKEEDT
jgi:hypothetical protein